MYRALFAASLVSVACAQYTSPDIAATLAKHIQNTKTAILSDDAAYFDDNIITPANAAMLYASASATRKASGLADGLIGALDDMTLELPDTALTLPALSLPTTNPEPIQAAPEPEPATHTLGSLSARYESNGRPDAIGWDKTGGWSWGSYQIATKTGTFGIWMQWLSDNHPQYHRALQQAGGKAGARAGTDGFKAAWKALAKDRGFALAQHEFIADSHYAILAGKLKRKGFNLDHKSHAMRDVAWSTAVQHGGDTDVFNDCISKSSEADVIRCVYAVRGGRFGKSSARVRASVRKRFVSEQAKALAMLAMLASNQ